MLGTDDILRYVDTWDYVILAFEFVYYIFVAYYIVEEVLEIIKIGKNGHCLSIQTYTRMGWCPRTGKGQRLMFKEAIKEYIWLATCQGKIYENKPPSAMHETI